MIAEREKYEVKGKLDGESIRLSIDNDAIQHVLGILTELYSDSEAAVVREISSNARDAHIEVGQTRPIEVTTPRALSPYFVVRDFGVGLSVDDLRDVYSKYGASTKRGSNDQVGMLGLGAKSPLAYASQFTVTSVKAGVKVQACVSRDEDGAGSIVIVDTHTTDEPNGTTVIVPAARDNGLDLKARGQYRFWPKGTVLLNGEQPATIDGIHITNKILAVTDSDCGDVIVMDSVAYPVDWSDYGHTLPYGVSMVALVDIGDVNFAPSREALMDTKRTKATMERVWQEWEAGKPSAVQRAVDKCDSAPAALDTVAVWQRRLKVPDTAYTWRGHTLPAEYKLPGSPANRLMVSPNGHGWLGESSQEAQIPARAWPSTVWVANFVPASYTAPHKKKMLAWCADKLQGKRVSQFVMLRGPAPVSPFIEKERVVEWEDCRVIDVSSGGGYGGGRLSIQPPGLYDTYVDGEYVRAEGKDIDRKNPIFWLHGNRHAGHTANRRLDRHYDNYTLVCLPANRIGKFCRIVKEAKTAQEGVEAARAAWLDSITDAQKIALAVSDSGASGALAALDASKVDDPELQSAIKSAKMDVRDLAETRRWFGGVELPKWDNPLVKYPLVASHRYGMPSGLAKQHVYLYINAAYAASQETV